MSISLVHTVRTCLGLLATHIYIETFEFLWHNVCVRRILALFTFVLFFSLIRHLDQTHNNFIHNPCPLLGTIYSKIVHKIQVYREKKKRITRYRRIGYNLNVMRQSASLVFNPIRVDNYAAFFNAPWWVGRQTL